MKLLENLNLRYLTYGSHEISFPFEVTEEIVEEIFEGKPKYTVKTITSKPRIGLVNGLYATNQEWEV